MIFFGSSYVKVLSLVNETRWSTSVSFFYPSSPFVFFTSLVFCHSFRSISSLYSSTRFVVGTHTHTSPVQWCLCPLPSVPRTGPLLPRQSETERVHGVSIVIGVSLSQMRIWKVNKILKGTLFSFVCFGGFGIERSPCLHLFLFFSSLLKWKVKYM